MEIIYNKESILYKGNFLEGPYRLDGIERIGKLVEPDFDEDELIFLVHPEKYMRKVYQTCKHKQILSEVKTDEFTFNAAKKAVSISVYAAQTGNFAAIRPPGHHASKEMAAGFCFFNNMAIATQYLLNEGKKVCILDIDGHYGNGTERIFYKDGRVLFWSIYQSPFVYNPFSMKGRQACDEIQFRRGERAGKGLIYNIPLIFESGDKELIEKFDSFIPKIKMFNPDYIGVSGGFDGYYKDKLLNLNFTKEGYKKFGEMVGSLGMKTFGILEGGYHKDVVSCIDNLVKGINRI